MKLRKRYVIATAIGLIAAIVPAAHAVSEGAPASIAPLLTPNARAAGLGQSYVAIADDATAAFWNPAGLAWQTKPDIVLMYSKLAEGLADDISYNYLAYSQPNFLGGGFAASLIFLNLGSSQAIDEQGEPIRDFSSFDFIPMISYGQALTPNLAYGASFKFIYSQLSPGIIELGIDDGTGISVGGDLSLLFRVPSWGLRFGLLVQNLGLDIVYNDQNQAEPLPRNGKLGVAYMPIDNPLHHLLATVEMTQSFVYLSGDAILKGGVEYEYYNMAAARIGYIYDTEGNIKDPTYGVGLKIKAINGRFDYASVPQAEGLPRVNRFALGFTY